MGANYGPTSQLRAKKIKWATLASFGGQLRPLLWASLASFNFFFLNRKLAGMVADGSQRWRLKVALVLAACWDSGPGHESGLKPSGIELNGPK
jgi:hypothetical protein